MTEPSQREQISAMRSKYSRKYQRRRNAALFGGVIAIDVAFATALMITVGIAHRNWWHAVPTMGYDTAVALVSVPMIAIGIAGWILAVLKD